MPSKKSKPSNRKARGLTEAKELQFKRPGEDYAQVTKKFGNDRILVFSLELNCEIPCHIRGSIRSNKVIKDGYVLISFRNLNNEYDNFLKTGIVADNMKGDVIYNYNDKDVNDLRKAGELTMKATEEDDGITLEGGDDELFLLEMAKRELDARKKAEEVKEASEEAKKNLRLAAGTSFGNKKVSLPHDTAESVPLEYVPRTQKEIMDDLVDLI